MRSGVYGRRGSAVAIKSLLYSQVQAIVPEIGSVLTTSSGGRSIGSGPSPSNVGVAGVPSGVASSSSTPLPVFVYEANGVATPSPAGLNDTNMLTPPSAPGAGAGPPPPPPR